MTCLICSRVATTTAKTSKGVEVRICKGCEKDLKSGELTKADLHIALNSKLHKKDIRLTDH